jgi:small multidrug resistance pump
MAICLFVNSYFKTLAASSLSSVILYPLNQGMSLVLSSAMAAVVFKERLNLKAIIGIFAAFAGLLIINLM